jgi:AraC-like DNA-binding protein
VVAVGLDAAFELTVGQQCITTRAAAVSSGTPRSVNGFGGRMGVTLIDPGLRATVSAACNGALEPARRLADGYSLAAWREYLEAIGSFASDGRCDERVQAAADRLRATCDENLTTAEVARDLGLSASRLERLFRAQVGTPMRSYRIWHRFRRVAQAMKGVDDLTQAAHAAGFFDSAHLNHAFRQSFGIAPTFVFQRGLVIDIVDSRLRHEDVGAI